MFNNVMKNKGGRFWISNNFMRVHARYLSAHAQSIYMYLCNRANRERETFVGYRRIAKELGFNKDTVVKKIKELKVYGLVIQSGSTKRGQVSSFKLLPVPNYPLKVSEESVQKECIKEYPKEGTINTRELMDKALNDYRTKQKVKN